MRVVHHENTNHAHCLHLKNNGQKGCGEWKQRGWGVRGTGKGEVEAEGDGYGASQSARKVDRTGKEEASVSMNKTTSEPVSEKKNKQQQRKKKLEGTNE